MSSTPQQLPSAALQNNGISVAGSSPPASLNGKHLPAAQQPPTFDLVTNTIVDAIVLPLLVGIFAVLSLNAAETANNQSQAANQLALLSLCAGLSSPGNEVRVVRFLTHRTTKREPLQVPSLIRMCNRQSQHPATRSSQWQTTSFP